MSAWLLLFVRLLIVRLLVVLLIIVQLASAKVFPQPSAVEPILSYPAIPSEPAVVILQVPVEQGGQEDF